ncbi:fatty acid desaturase family protein [Fluviispira multicolorata]|nr:fatty acid desaturase family protein [Fluviispira multicolorata]
MQDKEQSTPSVIVQRDKDELAKGYPKWFRFLETIGLILFFILVAIIAIRISIVANELWYFILPSLILGWIFSDFIGGLVHWAGDTWGSVDMPILGPALIRPFREHHVDPYAITRHDFIETNAACALAGVPILFSCLFLKMGKEFPISSFIAFFVFFLTIFVLFTNQIHKWAHTKKKNKILIFLQNAHIILNPEHHQIHHTPPFNKYYCITTGWLNSFLNSIGFFPKFEKLIMKYTHALPRRDDIGVSAAEKEIK